MAKFQPGFFDVPYGIPLAVVTVGLTIIATTGGDYFGLSIRAGGTEAAEMTVYDNASTTLGNILDVVIVSSALATNPERSYILKAKNGVTINLTGTEATGTIFYGPKG